MQTGAPVLQAVVPVRHGLFAMEQVDPTTHATQVPVELQTLSCPQAAPAGTFIPRSTQVGDALEQSSVPVWQALAAGVHTSPVTHGLQMPSWQTRPAPHDEPFGLLSVSVQTGAPVEQRTVPMRHGLLATSHDVPAAQAWQAPSRQTPLSQAVPLACGRCVSRHDIAPPLPQTDSPW
jgi:hypothetical protein